MGKEHFTRNTVEVQAWCKKCEKRTMHSVNDRRLGKCLTCFGKLEDEHKERKAPPARQAGLFEKE